MTIQPHDFSRPPSLRPETRSKLIEWLSRSNALLGEAIAALGLPAEIQLEDCVTAWPATALQEWSEKSVSFRVKLDDLESVSVFAIPNPMAQVLIGAVMGETLEEWPAERDLTPAELSVGEVLMTNIARSLIEGWTSDEVYNLRVTEQESLLRRTKIFKFKEPFVVCRSTIGTAIGSGQWCWMLPHEFLSHVFGSPRTTEHAAADSSRTQLESLAREMSTQITVRLGGVQLSAVQLSELQVGDLVVLNQRTTEPLKAFVSGKPRYLGWPGRVGGRQAFEISVDTSHRHQRAEHVPEVAAVASR